MTKAQLIAALAKYPDDTVIHVRDSWTNDGMFVSAREVRTEVRSDWQKWDGKGDIPTITVIEIDT